jgi:phosphonate transport system ATP-binding protein
MTAPACALSQSSRPGNCPCSQLEVDGLCIARDGRELIRNLTLSVPRGSFVALTGPSGAGKSSLLACLAGLLPTSAGNITYTCKANCRHTASNFQHRIGLVFQHLRLVPGATTLTNTLCGALGEKPWWKTVFGFDRGMKDRASALLEHLGIGDLRDVPVSRISGGEKQRVAIARAFMKNPELILADEPVSHLDEENSKSVLRGMKLEARRHETTILCSLHDERLVKEFADYELQLRKGEPDAWRLVRMASA